MIRFALAGVLALAGCSPGADTARAPAPHAGCEASKTVSTGTLCVVTPSKTDPAISDAFGDHVVGIPAGPSRGLWVHMSGAGGKPYYPARRGEGRYLNETWDTELMRQGYTVLDIAYDNTVAVIDSCGNAEGKALDNCAGNVRLEVLTGVDVSALRDVDRANSVENRVRTLSLYASINGLGPLFNGWSSVSVSGHSQGAGMAYYLAKYQGVQFACMLGGPYDVADDVPTRGQGIADWFLDPSTNETPVNRMGAFLATTDDAYQPFTGAYGVIGLTKDREWFEADAANYHDDKGKAIDGHAAAVQDPSLAALRAKACFR